MASPECDLTAVQSFSISSWPLDDSHFLYTSIIVIDYSLQLTQPAHFYWEILYKVEKKF